MVWKFLWVMELNTQGEWNDRGDPSLKACATAVTHVRTAVTQGRGGPCDEHPGADLFERRGCQAESTRQWCGKGCEEVSAGIEGFGLALATGGARQFASTEAIVDSVRVVSPVVFVVNVAVV